jgi:hypothetical protein
MPTHPRINLTIPRLDQLESVEDAHEVADALDIAAGYARTIARQWQAEAEGRLVAAAVLQRVADQLAKDFPTWLQWMQAHHQPEARA